MHKKQIGLMAVIDEPAIDRSSFLYLAKLGPDTLLLIVENKEVRDSFDPFLCDRLAREIDLDIINFKLGIPEIERDLSIKEPIRKNIAPTTSSFVNVFFEKKDVREKLKPPWNRAVFYEYHFPQFIIVTVTCKTVANETHARYGMLMNVTHLAYGKMTTSAQTSVPSTRKISIAASTFDFNPNWIGE